MSCEPGLQVTMSGEHLHEKKPLSFQLRRRQVSTQFFVYKPQSIHLRVIHAEASPTTLPKGKKEESEPLSETSRESSSSLPIMSC
mmetsp:Transcript_33061/g.65567  ORF Transcript_33061/g.65567 Transcript_33061/m.65567 type:complete len:85 (+) Transcript_33061:841-1095(+)